MATRLGCSHDNFLRRHKSSQGGRLPSPPLSVIVSTGNSSVFDYLCDELLIEILQRLPQKAAHRCKCVQRRWLNLISSKHFADCYVRYHSSSSASSSSCAVTTKNPPFALFYEFSPPDQIWVIPSHQLGLHLTPPEELDPLSNSPGFSVNFLPPLPPPSPSASFPRKNPSRFLASDKGLVLCCASRVFQSQYYVCDPITKHWVALPPPLNCAKSVRVGIVCKDNGGGRSFRVVRFPDKVEPGSSALKLEIFCSETGIWSQSVLEVRRIQHLQKLVHCPLHSSAFVCIGMLHWRSTSKLFVYDPYTRKRYLNTNIPEGINSKAYHHHLGECQGRVRYTEFSSLTFKVWELQDYDKEVGGWCLVFNVGMGQMVSETPWIVEYITLPRIYLHILAFHPFDGDFVFLELKGYHIVLCNLRNKTLELACGGVVPDRWKSRPKPMAFTIVLPWWPSPILAAAFAPDRIWQVIFMFLFILSIDFVFQFFFFVMR